MIKLVFKITPGCKIDKAYKQYEKAYKDNHNTVTAWMEEYKIKEWSTCENKVVSVIHPKFDRKEYKWTDGASRNRRNDIDPPCPGTICLKKNSFYEYSPDRKTAEGKALVKLWKSWEFSDSGKNVALDLVVGGQGTNFMHGTASSGTRWFAASMWRSKAGSLYSIVPRSEPYKPAEGMKEVLASTVLL